MAKHHHQALRWVADPFQAPESCSDSRRRFDFHSSRRGFVGSRLGRRTRFQGRTLPRDIRLLTRASVGAEEARQRPADGCSMNGWMDGLCVSDRSHQLSRYATSQQKQHGGGWWRYGGAVQRSVLPHLSDQRRKARHQPASKLLLNCSSLQCRCSLQAGLLIGRRR
jgi:hypothetical protein